MRYSGWGAADLAVHVFWRLEAWPLGGANTPLYPHGYLIPLAQHCQGLMHCSSVINTAAHDPRP